MARCLTPFHKRGDDGSWMAFPCGKCPPCHKRRVSGWSFRLMQHAKVADSALFITLTYATQHVPITPNGYMGLCKRDVQLFFKRLRKAHTKYREGYSANRQKIRYYAVGEYGSRTFRPHYHIILFNADKALIQRAWDIGAVHYGQLSEASAGYTLKYMCKDPHQKKHARDDRPMEFALMSKGLGANYLTDAMKQWHEGDVLNRMYCNLKGGVKIAMPRYYKLRLYTEAERLAIGQHLAATINEDDDLSAADKAERDIAEFTKAAIQAGRDRNKV